MANFIKIEEIVKDYLGDQEKYSTHELIRLINIANRGLRQLTYDILGDVKIDLIEVSSALRIDLPDDYVDYSFIGIVGSDGRIHTLGKKNDIPMAGSQNTVPKIGVDQYGSSGGIFGLGGGQNENGYYRPIIDADNWQMVLTSIAAGKWIYLEYINDGRQSDNNTKIHPYAEEALLAYIAWKDIANRRAVSLSEKQLRRADFYNEKRLANSRLKSFTKEEAIQQSRKAFKQAPRA